MAVTDGHTTQKGVFPMMNEAEKNVYRLLRSWRRLHVEKELFESRYDLSHAQKDERMEQLSRVLAMLEAWMRLLTADERYVIKRHLVDEMDWSSIVYEYNTKLLRAEGRTRSSLRRMQSHAIGKIARYAEVRGAWEKVTPSVLAGLRA